jgi:hypothetical protein
MKVSHERLRSIRHGYKLLESLRNDTRSISLAMMDKDNGDFIAEPTPEEDEYTFDQREYVRSFVDNHPDPRIQTILRGQFFTDDGKKTLKSIGDDIGVTKERARQLKNEALDSVLEGMILAGLSEKISSKTLVEAMERVQGLTPKKKVNELHHMGIPVALYNAFALKRKALKRTMRRRQRAS